MAGIVAVKTGALEHHTDGVELFAQLTPALGAHCEGGVRKGLTLIKLMITVFALVGVDGH